MTATEIIDSLGGVSALAARLGMSKQRVSNWRVCGRFPDSVELHGKLSALCAEKDIELDPSLFGWRTKDPA